MVEPRCRSRLLPSLSCPRTRRRSAATMTIASPNRTTGAPPITMPRRSRHEAISTWPVSTPVWARISVGRGSSGRRSTLRGRRAPTARALQRAGRSRGCGGAAATAMTPLWPTSGAAGPPGACRHCEPACAPHRSSRAIVSDAVRAIACGQVRSASPAAGSAGRSAPVRASPCRSRTGRGPRSVRPAEGHHLDPRLERYRRPAGRSRGCGQQPADFPAGGTLTARRGLWADSMSLNATATQAARKPGSCRDRHVVEHYLCSRVDLLQS